MSVHKRFLKFAPGLCLSISLLSSLALSPSLAAQSYVLVDLTAVTGAGSGFANDVNNNHIVIGTSFFCAVRWERIGGQWVEEELPEYGLAKGANAVNNAGMAVGWGWQINLPVYPVIWQGEDHEIIPVCCGGEAFDVGSSGQTVGMAVSFGSPITGFIWEDGDLTLLGDLTTAYGINDFGQVVGSVGANPALTASFWENIKGQWELTELGTLGGSYSAAFEINDNTQIVGRAHVPGDLDHAFLWEKGVMLDLGTLGGSESTARDVNDIGQVVGRAMTAEEELHAFIWQDGVMSDLNDLIVSETDLILTEANAINDLGTIVGQADTPGGGIHAFMARLLRNGDINLDAFVDPHDLALLLGSWGPCADCANCPADLDNDCTVGPLDLAILLGNWG